WRHREAMAALREVLALADAEALLLANGVLRPAADAAQAADFQDTASLHDECRWMDPAAAAESYPDVAAPHGALLIETGAAIDISRLSAAILSAVRRAGGEIRLGCTLTSFAERSDRVEVSLFDGSAHGASCRRLLLACGAGFRSLNALDGLGLHAVKGQTVDVRVNRDLSHLPHLSGKGYVVCSHNRATIGSSFEHEFENPEPDPDVGARLLARASKMLPALQEAVILSHRAGIRVTRVGRRLPVVGPLPRHGRVWIFTALGSKGLLMAPLIGSNLREFFADDRKIPDELRL
ncbi:MAG: FAD-dependent oxidoreductase, partial [Rhodothermales bacterium]|nr:FAD-dependent oxidoreductase [Rhodothermales bacterium]